MNWSAVTLQDGDSSSHRATKGLSESSDLQMFRISRSVMVMRGWVSSFVIIFLLFGAKAFAQEEARAAWQIMRFEVAASVSAATRTLTVRTKLAARNVGQGVGRTFTVRLNFAAQVKSASVNGTSATFRSREEPRTKLQQTTVNLPSSVAPNQTVTLEIEHSLPVQRNTGLAAISPEGAQFLPLAFWYPMPNTPYSARGADTAPFQLTISGLNANEKLVSSGRANGNSFDQPLNAQPFFLTGRWEVIEGADASRNVSAWLLAGPTEEERRAAERLVKLASSARAFFQDLLGPAPDVPIRLIAVRRGAGFKDGGTLLLEAAAFRRSKIDSSTALLIAETVAELWLGGATPIRGEGSSVVREGLARYLALLFIEKEFGKEAADAERDRQRSAYAALARRDGPLSQSSPLFETHFVAVPNKGAMVWRLAERTLGRDAFLSVLRAQLQAGRENGISLSSLRSALVERGGERLKVLLDYELDQPTTMDLLIGLPHQQGGDWVAALRNTGPIDASVTVQAATEGGKNLLAEAVIPARDFGEARFRTAERIVRVEVDPEKFYPQIDYSNDVAPHMPSVEEALNEATRLFTRQDYAGAERIAREGLSRSPHAQELRVILGRALLAQKRLDDAEREFRAVIDEKLPTPATLSWANVGLGEIALQRGQTAEAIKRFDEAVRSEGLLAAVIAARQARLRAESSQSSPPIDESARAFFAQLDQAIKSGRKAEIEALIMPGELSTFASGIVGTQPELWQTHLLRTERQSGDRLVAEATINVRALGQEKTISAVLVLARAGADWKLVEIPIFEER
jgi:hypothetical protein